MTRAYYVWWTICRAWSLWRARRAVEAYAHHRDELKRIGVRDAVELIFGEPRETEIR